MANKSFTLGDRKIGADAPCYLIVEVGTTCMGDIDKALALVEKAKEAGVDAIKFQVIDPQQVSDPNATYLIVHNGQEQRVNMKEMFDKLVFTEEQWKRIIDACAKVGLDFFATVDYLEGVDMLDRLGAKFHKIGVGRHLQATDRENRQDRQADVRRPRSHHGRTGASDRRLVHGRWRQRGLVHARLPYD
jgi:sialic acid synthase SpsE